MTEDKILGFRRANARFGFAVDTVQRPVVAEKGVRRVWSGEALTPTSVFGPGTLMR